MLRPVVDLLDAMGAGTDRLLAGERLVRQQLQDPLATIPLHRYVAFLETTSRQVGDVAFGSRVGALLKFADLGPVGLLFSLVPTLREALGYLVRYFGTLQSGTTLTLHGEEGCSLLSYRIEDPSIWPRVQENELTLSATCSMIRSRLGPGWAPVEVRFEHDGRPGCRHLRQVFRAPIRYRQAANQLVLTPADLDRPLRSQVADVMLALERHVNELLSRSRLPDADAPAGTLAERVRRLLAARVGHGQHSVADLAAELRLSRRSLQRRLAAEGCSVRDLLREHRHRSARARLHAPDVRVGQVATALGYADGTAFWRAFRRWNGSSPTEHRAATGRAGRWGR